MDLHSGTLKPDQRRGEKRRNETKRKKEDSISVEVERGKRRLYEVLSIDWMDGWMDVKMRWVGFASWHTETRTDLICK